jgi:molecular chaperone DnaJ
MTINEAQKILGIDKNSSEDEIKKVYKKLALENHPDRFVDEKEKQNKEEAFKKINEAYQVLCQKSSSQIPNGFSGFPFDINDFFKNINAYEWENNFSNFSQRRKWQAQSQDRANLILNITLTFEEILIGSKKEFEIVDYNKCDECNGDPFKNKKPCDECGGTGFVIQKKQFQQMQMVTKNTCSKCFGNGFTAEEVCEKCKGSGVEKVIRKFVLNIPKAEEIK